MKTVTKLEAEALSDWPRSSAKLPILRGNRTVSMSEREVLSSSAVEEDGATCPQDAVSMWMTAYQDALPSWVKQNLDTYGERLVVPEWESPDFRAKNGWSGHDFMHDKDAPVRLLDYYVQYGNGIRGLPRGGEGTTLTGVVHYTPRAESHKGFCHGGSMTAIMDDVIGWAGFLVTGQCKPWTGFTGQINTSLRKPIAVGSWLVVRGNITKVERRKVSVTATLFDPANNDAVHAEGEGLVILNSGVLPSQ